jgi:dUTP pyrophosphatase
VKIALPVGHEAQIRPRSGLAAKQSVTVLNSPEPSTQITVVRSVILINHGQTDFTITRGERIAQMVVAKYEAMNLYQVNGSRQDFRGVGGFGSTGA